MRSRTSLLRALPLFIATVFVTLAIAAPAGDLRAKQLWATRSQVALALGSRNTVLTDDGAICALANRGGRRTLVKYGASDGDLKWHTDLGAVNDFFAGLAIDSTNHLATFLQRQGVTLRISPSGKIEWFQRARFYPTAIAVDLSGDVVVTGTSGVGYGATTIKYAAADGRVLWQHIDPAPINFQVIAVDYAGDVILGGTGPGIHVTKLAGSTGMQLWSRDYHPYRRTFDYVTGVALDPVGNVAVSGNMSFSRSGSIAVIPPEGDDSFNLPYVARYSGRDGSILWQHLQRDSTYATAAGVATDSSGNVIVVKSRFGIRFITTKYSADRGTELWTVGKRGHNSLGSAAIFVDEKDDVIFSAATSIAANNDIYYTAKYRSTDGVERWRKVLPVRHSTFGHGTAVAPGIVAISGSNFHNSLFVKYADGPTPRTLSSEVLDSSIARLHARVNPNGFISQAAFVLGTDPNLQNATVVGYDSVGDGKEPINVTATATSLRPGTTYYFRAIGITGDHETFGEIRQFTTPLAGN